MRRTIVLLLSALALNVAAQTVPPKLEPLPEPPPAPTALDESLEPQVTITKRGEDKVEEYRVSGKLYMLKVTPPHGVPYYLIDNNGDGSFVRQPGSLDSGLRVPMWVIGTF
jgi:hypothetical protein